MAAWRYEISLLMLKKYFMSECSERVKYFSTLKEKFCISVCGHVISSIVSLVTECSIALWTKAWLFSTTNLWHSFRYDIALRYGNIYHQWQEPSKVITASKPGMLISRRLCRDPISGDWDGACCCCCWNSVRQYQQLCHYSLTSPYGHLSIMDSLFGPWNAKDHTFLPLLIWTPL